MNANNEPNLIGCAERNSDGGGVLRLGRRQRRPGARLLLHRLRQLIDVGADAGAGASAGGGGGAGAATDAAAGTSAAAVATGSGGTAAGAATAASTVVEW